MGFFSNVGNWFKGAANTIHNSVLKPVYENAIKPVYEKAVVPVFNAGVGVVTKVAEKAEQVVDIGINAVKNTSENLAGFGKLLSNPVVLIGGLVVGGIILTKVLEAKR